MTFNHRPLYILGIVALWAALALAGCGDSTTNAPPPGGPQQNDHVPPGEKAKTNGPTSPQGH